MSDTDMKPFDRFADFIYESTRIFRARDMAWDLKKFVFALAAVVIWALGAMLINVLMAKSWVILVAAGIAAIVFIIIVFSYSQSELTRASIAFLVGSIVAVAGIVIVLVFVTKKFDHDDKALLFQPLWALAVASFFGTAIARIAAVYAATEDNLGFRDAARFALGKLATSIWTLLIPAAALLGFAVFLMCLGAPGRIPGVKYVWDIVLGVPYIILLLGGLCFALVLVMYIPGMMLFQPAIATEGEDAFGAFSKVYGFVLQKPWRLAFYSVLAYVYGRIVLTVAALIVIYAGRITNKPLAWGVGERMTENASKLDLGTIFKGSFLSWKGPGVAPFSHILGGHVYESFEGVSLAGWFIIFWQYVLLALFMAFAVTLFYCLATQVYLLMRKAADGTPFGEVYIEEPEEEQFAGEFAETPRPAEVKKPPLEDLAEKAAPKAKTKESQSDEPIELVDTEKPPEEEGDPGK